MIRRYGRSGWFGNSTGHALAAQGVKLYAKKSTPSLVDPIFYARREKQVPFNHIVEMVKEGKTYSQIKQMHPEVDSEDLRASGIKACEARQGTNTLSVLNRQGIDATVRMAGHDPTFKERVHETLKDPQASSFLPSVKVMSLKERLPA